MISFSAALPFFEPDQALHGLFFSVYAFYVNCLQEASIYFSMLNFSIAIHHRVMDGSRDWGSWRICTLKAASQVLSSRKGSISHIGVMLSACFRPQL